MAVVLDSVSPADDAIDVLANVPVIIELSDSTDMTLSLVEVLLDSQSFTVANGGLDYWSVKTESGGSIVDDLTSVTFATVVDWHTISGREITVVVKYNSSTISTTAFTVTDYPYQSQTGGAPAMFNTLEAAVSPASSRLHYHIWNIGTDRCAALISYWVLERRQGSAGVYYWVAFPASDSLPLSTVVGERAGDSVPLSTVVQGIADGGVPLSVIVQGWFAGQAVPISMLTGVRFRFEDKISFVVGLPIMESIPVSVVVYAVIKDTEVEVSVKDPSTVTLLESLGVIFG